MRRLPLRPLSTVLAAALGLLVVVLLGTATPAAAHTRLVSSTPAQGTPAEAPSEVVLVFSDPVQPGLSAVSVTAADGAEHASGTPAQGGDGSAVTQALRAPLAPGSYRVAYRVLAADGHPITGELTVTAVAAPAAVPTAAASVAPTAAPTTAVPAPDETTGPTEVTAAEVDDGGLPLLPLVVGGLVVAGTAGLLARRLGGAPPTA